MSTKQQPLYKFFHDLEDKMNESVFERRQENHTAILSILAKKHHFQLGVPGTAKSYLVTELFKLIGDVQDDDLFRYLLSKYTTPDELYGPPNMLLFREKGIYKRNTTGKLPTAKIAFLDEIFKGNSSILNANLSLMNERLFDNGPGEDPTIPLITMFGASNELPQGDELGAMWDRLHFRHHVSPLQETSNFMKMLAIKNNPNPEKIITIDMIYKAHAAVADVKIPSEVLEALKGLRDDLRTEGVEPSERRWRECIGIIQAEAFFNGNEIAEVNDMRPLMHVLWGTDISVDHIRLVRKYVLELANPIDRKASELLDSIIEMQVVYKTNVDDADNPKVVNKLSVEAYRKLELAGEEIRELHKENKASGKKSQILDELVEKAQDFGNILVKIGFGYEDENTLQL